jgi:1-acyl-sn-glycerol-3-phosphate acyltransferase
MHGMRYRERPVLDHSRLRWYREITSTYGVTAHRLVPSALWALARISVAGLDNVPSAGPIILAANHVDNLDPYLLLHLVPRQVHFAARPDGFGTGALCAIWRRLGAFPADAWGIRYGLKLLAEDAAVGVFPQGTISRNLVTQCGAAGVLALYSGAPVVPIAIRATDEIHLTSMLVRRVHVRVRFGTPLAFSRCGSTALRSRAVSDEILHHIQELLLD